MILNKTMPDTILTVPKNCRIGYKYISKTKYKYVELCSYDGVMTYRAYLQKFKWWKCFADLKEAAIAVDKKLIEKKQKPVNVLINNHN